MSIHSIIHQLGQTSSAHSYISGQVEETKRRASSVVVLWFVWVAYKVAPRKSCWGWANKLIGTGRASERERLKRNNWIWIYRLEYYCLSVPPEIYGHKCVCTAFSEATSESAMNLANFSPTSTHLPIILPKVICYSWQLKASTFNILILQERNVRRERETTNSPC